MGKKQLEKEMKGKILFLMSSKILKYKNKFNKLYTQFGANIISY